MKMEPAKSFEAEQLFVDLDKPSLQGLSYVLRHKELWPEGFEWNYRDCRRCAMGLAVELWQEVKWHWEDGERNNITSPEIMAKAFPIEKIAAHEIFCGAAYVHNIYMGKVRPAMVADDIDAYLARQ